MNPRLRQLIEQAAESFLNYDEPGLDVFECFNRNEDDPYDMGMLFAAALDKHVHRMRQRYFKTQFEAVLKEQELEERHPGDEFEVRETSMGKFLVMRR